MTWHPTLVVLSFIRRNVHAERDHLLKITFPTQRKKLEKHRARPANMDVLGELLDMIRQLRLIQQSLRVVTLMSRRAPWVILICFPTFCGCLGHYDMSVVSSNQAGHGKCDMSASGQARKKLAKRTWRERVCLDLAINQSFALLNESQGDIDSQINLPVRALGLEKKPVRTFQDWRREGKLLTPIIGIGYDVSDMWTVGLRGGYTHGREKNDRLLVLGPMKADFEYSALGLQIYASFYPLAKPQPLSEDRRGHIWSDGKPVIWQAVSATRYTARADVRFHLGPFPVFNKSVRIDDWIAAYHLGLGWEWPIRTDWNAQIIGTYSFNFDRSDEFNGFGASLVLVRRF